MLRWYDLYGGICRPPTLPYWSKQFRQCATMTLSAAPSPLYRHPPCIYDIRGWDDFFLNSPRSTPSDRRNFGSDFLVPPKSHGQKQSSLASTPEISFFCKSSPCLLASSRKTPETSLFHATCTTTFHINGNEMTQPIPDQRNDDHGERDIPPPAQRSHRILLVRVRAIGQD